MALNNHIMNIKEFYDSTPKDVNMMFSAFNYQQKRNAVRDYQLAQTTAIMVGHMLNGRKFPDLEDMYPNVFTAEDKQERINQENIEKLLNAINKHNQEVRNTK